MKQFPALGKQNNIWQLDWIILGDKNKVCNGINEQIFSLKIEVVEYCFGSRISGEMKVSQHALILLCSICDYFTDPDPAI